MSGLHIRPYVPDQDDELLLSITNTAYAAEPEFIPETIEQFRVYRQAPDWTAEGRFIAEYDRLPVGTVTGHVDPHRTEPVGFLEGPAVLPTHRRRGVGTALARRALDHLRTIGIERARTAAGDEDQTALDFLKRLGFRPVRRFSLMRRPLTELPAGIGEQAGIAIEDAGTSDEAIKLLTRLQNEAFREHFGHRDGTEESQRFWVDNAVRMGFVVRRTIASLEGRPVGFLIHGHCPRESELLDVKRGGLWSVGVLKGFRNRGIAARLMLDGMAWLAAQGLEEVELGVDDENVTRARRLYERLGFRVVRGSTTFELPLGDSGPAAGSP